MKIFLYKIIKIKIYLNRMWLRGRLWDKDDNEI